MKRHALPLLALALLASACDRRDSAAERTAIPVFRGAALVRGVYTSAFETSRLEPCGSSEAWWVGGEDTAFAVLAPALRARDQRPEPSGGIGFARVYVVVRGDTTARGKFGHMGAYDRELALRQVDSVTGAIPADCEVEARAD